MAGESLIEAAFAIDPWLVALRYQVRIRTYISSREHSRHQVTLESAGPESEEDVFCSRWPAT